MPQQYLHALMYAGLAGTALALVVATGQNRWSPRVFFLLALRLSIGWHFLFEGLNKVHSHLHGPNDTTRTFTSEPYFKVAPGRLGAEMRKSFGDPAEVFAAKVRATEDIKPADFDKLSNDEQAKRCPPAVAAELDDQVEKAKASIEKAIAVADEAIGLSDTEYKTDASKAEAKARAEQAKKSAEKARDAIPATVGPLLTSAKAKYARWVYGVEGRDTKLKSTTGEAWFTAPQRLAYLDWVRGQLAEAQGRFDAGVGNGTGTDAKRTAEFRTELIAAEAALVKDASDFVVELRKDLPQVMKDLNGKSPEEPTPPRSLGQKMDLVTMWFLVGVGALLMGGLFTRVACVLATGFLVLTYLAHPPVPWYPLPPNTEGNPLFINKNVIEALALLTIASFPTGRWLGLDALLSRVCCRTPKDDTPTA